MAQGSPINHGQHHSQRHASRNRPRHVLGSTRTRPPSSYHDTPTYHERRSSSTSTRTYPRGYAASQSYFGYNEYKLQMRSGSRRVDRRDARIHTPRKQSIEYRKESGDYYRHPERLRASSGQPLVPQDASKGRQRTRRSDRYPNEKNRHSHTRGRRRKPFWRRWWLLWLAIVLAALAIIIGLAAGLTARKKKQEAQKTPTGSSAPSNSSLSSIAPSSIPQSVRGTYLDPFTWVDTTDFNLTYTPVTFGNLSVMGLNDSYSDAARPNPSIPPLNQPFPYAHTPIRGVNLGGWLSTEPFITPSLFSSVSITPSIHAIVDEYTLSLALGTTLAGQHLENHYASFVRRETFSAIRAAGFDHVRFNFPYWAVQTYDGDPYVPHTCWRYLLRGIEWARAEGLRVCLDLHSAPGSQNGNDHSGRRGGIGWLDGTPQGQLNADRTLQIHNQLAAFFGQERYRNVITIYGVLNEPRMVDLDTDVVLNWTSVAIAQLRASPLPDDTILVISDGFLPLTTWHTALPALRLQNANPSDARILLDAHQYVIFNTAQLALNHSAKLDFACQGWNQQTTASMDPTTGFGNFLCGEWSQADTDCAAAVNGVGIGSRWAGTLDTGNASTSVLTPSCPPGGACDCGGANADPSGYGRGYQEWLKKFAEAQVRSFEVGWGWFYWTWDTEGGDGTSQWSWRRGVEAGILPSDVSTGGRGVFWDCGGGGYGEDWEAMGLGEAY